MKLPEYLASLIPEDDTRLLGEVVISRQPGNGAYQAIHFDDRGKDPAELEELNEVPAIREMTKYDAEGEYRPLKTAPTMKAGWIIIDKDIERFYTKIDAIYPAGFAGTARYFKQEAKAVPLRNTLDRQTGMYQFAKNITDTHANQIMRETCAKGCMRKIAWPIDERCPVSMLPEPDRKIPIVCLEACTFAVTEARRLAREAYDKANAPD